MAKEQKGLEGPFLPNIACRLLHLVRCDVFLMSGDPPEMPEGIFELAGVVAVSLIFLGVAQAGEDGSHPLGESRAIDARNRSSRSSSAVNGATAAASPSPSPR